MRGREAPGSQATNVILKGQQQAGSVGRVLRARNQLHTGLNSLAGDNSV